jgi:hypothetical protein
MVLPGWQFSSAFFRTLAVAKDPAARGKPINGEGQRRRKPGGFFFLSCSF